MELKGFKLSDGTKIDIPVYDDTMTIGETTQSVKEFVSSQNQDIVDLQDSKSNVLIAGDNITLKSNEDGTITISSSGGSSNVDDAFAMIFGELESEASE